MSTPTPRLQPAPPQHTSDRVLWVIGLTVAALLGAVFVIGQVAQSRAALALFCFGVAVCAVVVMVTNLRRR